MHCVIRRRDFVVGLGVAFIAPFSVEARQAEKVARIAFRSTQSAAAGQGFAEASTQGLRELG